MGQIPLADRIVLGRCDEDMTGGFDKPGAESGSSRRYKILDDDLSLRWGML